MNEKMQVIETSYNGYLFRSRTEARWAVFFDVLGVKYQYEPEGYVLENGTKYLPDFYVTDFMGETGYFEVKPDTPIQKVWLEKLEMLGRGLGASVYLLNGPPDYKYYQYYKAEYDDDTFDIVHNWHYIQFSQKKVITPVRPKDMYTHRNFILFTYNQRYRVALEASREERF